ncbi:MAG: cell envelope integrity protein TolA [Hyphomicrobiales bacterium]
MRLTVANWTAALTLSVAAHLALFGSRPAPVELSGESGAGTPAVVWGLAASSMTQEAMPVDAERQIELPVEDRAEAQVEAISDTAPGLVAAVEAVSPAEDTVREPVPEKPAEKRKPPASEAGGPVGQQTGSSASTRSSASAAGVSTYSSRVLAHLNRFKRYPGGGARGTVSMIFVVGSNGAVQSVRISGRSGSPRLDEAALAMVRRASPFPSIPSDIGRTTMAFSVPVHFSP